MLKLTGFVQTDEEDSYSEIEVFIDRTDPDTPLLALKQDGDTLYCDAQRGAELAKAITELTK